MGGSKVALITGANKGIGFEIARRLGELHFSVWLGCRDVQRGEGAATRLRNSGVDAHVLVLDVTDEPSVSAAAATLARSVDRLDVLVNNAGIAVGPRARPSEEKIDNIKAVYEVNVFGPLRTTQAFLPLLRKSKEPRVVMMSSGLGSIAAALDPASPISAFNILSYNTSKSALNAITVSLAKDLEDEGIKINAADPGYTATDLTAHKGHRTVEEAAEIAVRLATLDDDGPTAGYFDEQGALPW